MRAELPQRLDQLTEAIIGAAFAVSNALGHGFLESVYKNALVEELTSQGFMVVKEKAYSVLYRDKIVGNYVADIVVEDTVIVELKAIDQLTPTHRAQLLNYLKASSLPVGLLLNFGAAKLQMKRVIL